jgi:hypothetical protein
VDQAVEDPVGHRRVADLLVATRYRLVRGENPGSGLIPVFAESQKSRRSGSFNGAHGPVIDHE